MEMRYCDRCGKDLGRMDAYPTFFARSQRMQMQNGSEYKRFELTGYKPGHLCVGCSVLCAKENGLKKLVDRGSV